MLLPELPLEGLPDEFAGMTPRQIMASIAGDIWESFGSRNEGLQLFAEELEEAEYFDEFAQLAPGPYDSQRVYKQLAALAYVGITAALLFGIEQIKAESN